VGDFTTLATGERLEARRPPARLRALALLGGAIQWETIQILFNEGYVDGYRRLHPLERGFTFPIEMRTEDLAICRTGQPPRS
jgi:hypothetical protein